MTPLETTSGAGTSAREPGAAGDVRVVRVGEEDWRSHRDLRLDMLADSPRAFWAQLAEVQDRTPEQWREELRGPRIHLQARCVDQVMGSLAVLPQGYTPEHVIGEDQAILVSLWVRPEARGSGASRALFRAAAELALELGRPHLLLEVDDAGHAARRLYARLGFTETGTRHPRESTGGEWIEYEGRAEHLLQI